MAWTWISTGPCRQTMSEHNRLLPLIVNGWTIFAHPLFLEQLETLIRQVEALKLKDPVGYVKKNASKRLAATARLAFEVIPQDPTRVEYRQGNTLGDARRHWFRAKFFQQYRLFFRYHAPSRMIVYAWVNDEDTKRAYERDDDAYRIFRHMLDSGHPPDDWDQLLVEAHACTARMQAIAGAYTGPSSS
ncbi:toxin YhaV [Thiobaca trueperi]|uniref:Toxin YhaV n=2 Tax=Thiobaca trueperi TaxID=127458 RepID=A0A4R3MTB9_9GAMM|nr:toxin YhaV [Thiobaca trueperi]